MARGFSDISIGSDTGGSVRIPAALNGITGFKPTQQRVPRDGAFPLSFAGRGWPAGAQRARMRPGRCRHGWPAVAAAAAPPAARPARRACRAVCCSRRPNAVAQAFEQVLQALAQGRRPCGRRGAGRLAGCTRPAAAKRQHHRCRSRAYSRRRAGPPARRHRLRRAGAPASGPVDHGGALRRPAARAPAPEAELDAQIADYDVLLLPTVPMQAPRIDALTMTPTPTTAPTCCCCATPRCSTSTTCQRCRCRSRSPRACCRSA